MNLINSLSHHIPTGYGFVLAFLVLALFAAKELRRAWHRQTLLDATDKSMPAPRRLRWENGLITLLLALYGLILLVRLLSFFP